MQAYSVIIPHKNTPALLQRCLDSLASQPDMEIIVVDDNSSPDLVDFNHFPGSERADVQTVLTKEGRGAGYARNVAMAIARGRWLIFVDADDMVTPEFSSLIASHRDDDVDMVLFKAASIVEQTGEPSNRHLHHNQAIEGALKGQESERQAAIGVAAPWCRMIKRELVTKNNLRFDETMVANDVMFISRCVCMADGFAFDPGVLYVITERRDSLITSHRVDADRYMTRMEVCARANDLWRNHGLRRLPILRMVWQARRYGLLMKSLAFAIRKGIFFSGISNYGYLIKRKLQ